MTTALYYTPSGRSIQEVGIAPDIEVSAVPVGQQTARRLRVRERDLEGHFTHEEAEPEAERDENEGEADDEPEDLQLSRAVEVLKSWNYFERLSGSPPPETTRETARAAAPASEGTAESTP